MKKLYDSPELDIIAFEMGDILAEISVGDGGAIGEGEGEIGWLSNLSGSGADSLTSNDIKNILE